MLLAQLELGPFALRGVDHRCEVVPACERGPSMKDLVEEQTIRVDIAADVARDEAECAGDLGRLVARCAERLGGIRCVARSQ